jgi:hypothetical protein
MKDSPPAEQQAMIIEDGFRSGSQRRARSIRISSIACRRATPDVVARTLRRKLNRAAAAVGIAFGLIACDPYVDVEGVIRDSSGAPLPDVAVTLTMPGRVPDRATTASDGSYNVGIVGADSKRTLISFRKVGFKPVEAVVGKPDQRTMDVTLFRE